MQRLAIYWIYKPECAQKKEEIAGGFSTATFRKLVPINKKWGWGSGLQECTKAEENYLRLRIRASNLDERIESRRKFEAIFIDPDSHEGFFDQKATYQKEKRFLPISQRITLKEPYATFFQELKALREKMGRGDISPQDALTQALKLEENAGLKGIVVGDAEDVEAANIFLEQMDDEIRELCNKFRRQARSRSEWSDQEAEIGGQIRKFMLPITNGLQLKPIEPVTRNFEEAVQGMLTAIPGAFLGPEPRHEAERPAVTRARAWLGAFARQNPDFLTAVEAFVRAAAEHGRVDANLILDCSEKPEAEPAEALVMKGAGGS